MSSSQPAGPSGYLRTCIDKRFVAEARTKFELHAHLGRTDYYHESYPGGSAKVVCDPVGGDVYTSVGEDHAYKNGATVYAWQAHIAVCGGLPGKTDEEIEKDLDDVVALKVAKYRDLIKDLRIYKILGKPESEGGTVITLVYPPPDTSV